MKTPPLSVVIPTRDTRALTLRCLGSFLDRWNDLQTAGDPPEVAVVDDGGRDGTADEVARRYPGVEVVRHTEPVGFTGAANAGLACSTGEILLLLNSDTLTSPADLRRLVEGFSERPRLGIAGANLVYPNGSPQWSGGGEPTLLWLFSLSSGLPALLGRLPFYRRLQPVRGSGGGRVDWVRGAALAMRREVWEGIGPLDARFRFYCQDLDLCLRARDAGWEIAVLPDVRVIHLHGATIDKDPEFRAWGRRLGLLWSDLLLWAEKHRGSRWARRAGSTLRAGATLRIWVRGAVTLLVPPGRRADWREGTKALAIARDALPRSPGSGRDDPGSDL